MTSHERWAKLMPREPDAAAEDIALDNSKKESDKSE